MSIQYVGKPCEDCSSGVCTMNCSGASPATRSEWIAASMWARVFPKKASAEQVRAWKASNAPVPAQIDSPAVAVVPVTPTPDMVAAGATVWGAGGVVYVEDIYVAMIGAAPQSMLDEDWLTDVLNDSLDADWTGRDGAKAIIAALSTATNSGMVSVPKELNAKMLEAVGKAFREHTGTIASLYQDMWSAALAATIPATGHAATEGEGA